MSLNTNNAILSNAITVDSSYRVGIGTTSPARTLSVVGTVGFYNNTGANDSQLLQYNDGSLSVIASTYGSTGSYTPLVFKTSDAERMTITSAGYVGIGTSTPVRPLDIYDASTPVFAMHNSTTTGSNDRGFLIYVSGSDSYIQNKESTGILGFITGGNTERMRITSAGNVGINGTPTSYSTNVYFDVIGNSTNQGGIIQTRNSDNSVIGSFFTNLNGLNIRTETSHPMLFSTAGSERMRITSAGNVGIGTSSPTGQLSIANQISNGSNPVSSYAATSGVNGQNFFNGYYAVNSDGLGTFPRYLDIVSVGSPDGSNGGSNIRFFTNPIATSSPAVERMRISSSGAITTPSQPAFRAYYSVNGFWNLNTNDLFNFDSTEYNIGSCFNTSNGSFTAPVAGVYQFNFYAIVYGAITNGAISFRKNGGFPASGYNVHFSPTQAGAWSNVVYTTSIYLSAGDYVQMYNTGGYTQYHGKDWSSFSGYLVG